MQHYTQIIFYPLKGTEKIQGLSYWGLLTACILFSNISWLWDEQKWNVVCLIWLHYHESPTVGGGEQSGSQMTKTGKTSQSQSDRKDSKFILSSSA